MRQKAFTIIELLVALVIISFVFMMTITVKLPKQTAKRQAEKLSAWLERNMMRAEVARKNFSLEFYIEDKQKVSCRWLDKEVDTIKADEGCLFERTSGINDYSKALIYSAEYGTLTPGVTIRIIGADGSIYFLKVSGQGRVRILPEDDSEE